MLDKCRKKADARGKTIDLRVSDFRELTKNFPEQFDCVASTGNSLGYVENEEVLGVLEQMSALIAPGGYLYFDLRNWDKIVRTKQRFYIDVLADERNHNTRHICVSMYGISEGTVDNAPQVIAKVDLVPSGRTENMSIVSLVVENHKPDVFLVYSVEDFIEVVAELLAGNPFHRFDGFHAS